MTEVLSSERAAIVREAAFAALYAYITAKELHNSTSDEIYITAIDSAMLNLERALTGGK